VNLILPIPTELRALIDEGFWPRDSDAARIQNLRPLIPESLVRRFAPEESKIYLYSPPFPLVRKLMESGEERFWSDPRTAVHEIDPDRTLVIGDFGLGSDAPIALDYRKSTPDPAVIRLRWAREGNHWLEVASNFAAFASYLRRNKGP